MINNALFNYLNYLNESDVIVTTTFSRENKLLDSQDSHVCMYWLLVCCACLTPPFSMHRVFIFNLQKEIEKQIGHRSSRKRRSESQYDYEVYHTLEEVKVELSIYLAVSCSPQRSDLTLT